MKKLSVAFMFAGLISTNAFADKFACRNSLLQKINKQENLSEKLEYTGIGMLVTTGLVGAGIPPVFIGVPVGAALTGWGAIVGKKAEGSLYIYEILNEANSNPDEYFKKHEELHIKKETQKALTKLNEVVNPQRVSCGEPPLTIDEYILLHPLKPFDRAAVFTPVKAFMKELTSTSSVSYDDVISAIQSITTEEDLCPNYKRPIKFKEFKELVFSKL